MRGKKLQAPVLNVRCVCATGRGTIWCIEKWGLGGVLSRFAVAFYNIQTVAPLKMARKKPRYSSSAQVRTGFSAVITCIVCRWGKAWCNGREHCTRQSWSKLDSSPGQPSPLRFLSVSTVNWYWRYARAQSGLICLLGESNLRDEGPSTAKEADGRSNRRSLVRRRLPWKSLGILKDVFVREVFVLFVLMMVQKWASSEVNSVKRRVLKSNRTQEISWVKGVPCSRRYPSQPAMLKRYSIIFRVYFMLLI